MMKTKLYIAILSLALAVGFSACNEKWEPGSIESGEKGCLSTADLTVDLNNAEQIIESRAAVVDLTNFIVSVIDKDGVLVDEWKYSEMPALPSFNVGTYTLKVASGMSVKADWEQPYFVGEKQFTIVKDDVTNAGVVTCKLQNLKVTVKFSDELVEASPDKDLQCVIRVNEQGVLTFTPGESRSGYFEVVPGNTTMVATFTGTVNGYKEEIIRLYKDINPGQHRIITFSLKNSNVEMPEETGTIDPTGGINVDFWVEDEDLSGNVNTGGEDVIEGTRPGDEVWPDDPGTGEPGTDDPTDPDTPSDCISFDSSTLDLSDGNVNVATDFGPGVKDAVVTISVEHGFAHLNVTINSVGLNEDELGQIGLPKSFDLAYPADDEVADALTQLNFPIRDGVIGKTSVNFDITTFVPLLPNFDGPHEFLIEAVDSQGHAKTLILKFING